MGMVWVNIMDPQVRDWFDTTHEELCAFQLVNPWFDAFQYPAGCYTHRHTVDGQNPAPVGNYWVAMKHCI